LVITTTALRFQALKEKEEEMVANDPVKTPSGDHPKAVVDLEIVKIVSQNLTTFDGQGAEKTVARVTPDDANQEQRAEV
jgi:hypothetical protein